MTRVSKNLAFAFAVMASPAGAAPLAEALSAGKPFGDFRYRVEAVDQQGFARGALASTLRSRLGYETGTYNGFKALLEFEDISSIGDDRFNSTVNGRAQFPVVADPKATGVNRVQLRYDSDEVDVTLGRQRLTLDNQRFIGNVGFRQNEQTFDAVRIDAAPVKDATLTYAYVWRVNRVFGSKSPQGRFRGDTHLVNGSLKLGAGTFAAYVYAVDANPLDTASSTTLGLRYAGVRGLGEGSKLNFTVEYAHQDDAKRNPFDYSLGYLMAEAGATVGAFAARAGYEKLGGNGRVGISTPLATLHVFQGYADAFLNTPGVGVKDRYAAIEYTFDNVSPLNRLRLSAWYHDYGRVVGTGSLGHEVNLVASAAAPQGVTMELKFADYDGNGFAPSRQKIWASLGVSF